MEEQHAETQDRGKRIAFVALAVVATAAAIAAVVWLVVARQPISVVTPALTDEQTGFLADYLSTNPPDGGYTFADETPSGAAPRIVVDLTGHIARRASTTAAETLTTPAEAIPDSIIRSVQTDGGVFAYPIALDHVEVAYRRDLFDATLLTADGRIRDLPAFERGLSALVGGVARYPLVTAGGHDRTLIDLVSVLGLSIGGSDRYVRLLGLDYADPAAVISQDLGEGWTLQSVVDLLADWKERRLLHPDWDELSDADVRELAQRQLAGAVVMRLSTHRSWPVQTLHRIQTTPFPFADPGDAGEALIAPTVAAAYTGRAGRVDEATRIVDTMVGRPFQDEVVRAWRLAPVHSTAEPLDRESRDLRFWAAASRLVLPSLSDVMQPEHRDALADYLRAML